MTDEHARRTPHDEDKDESTDLKDHFESVENPADWIHCPHCGSEDVEVEDLSPYSDYRGRVDCQECPAKGFFP